jgi:hypothetical protein
MILPQAQVKDNTGIVLFENGIKKFLCGDSCGKHVNDTK